MDNTHSYISSVVANEMKAPAQDVGRIVMRMVQFTVDRAVVDQVGGFVEDALRGVRLNDG